MCVHACDCVHASVSGYMHAGARVCMPVIVCMQASMSVNMHACACVYVFFAYF